MKKIFISILAIAALAACAKTGVEYDEPGEIGFAPAKGNITKATGFSGDLDEDQMLGVWAYWDKDGDVAEGITNYAAFDDNYLVNALFAKKTVNNVSAWGGANEAYPWPVNGSLVFAGYTTPGTAVLANTAVGYNLGTDVMTFTSYENTSEFDLCWFKRTANSYNYRAEGTAVPVTLSHALTWVSVAVYGEGAPVGNWKVTSIVLNQVVKSGTATCTGATGKATWTVGTKHNVTAFSGEHTIAAATTVDGKSTGAKLTDNVIIPSIPVDLTVNYSFLVNGVEKTDSKTVTLKLNEGNTLAWESGVHYTYTLVFKANEILVAPSYTAWGEVDKTVIVE